MRHNVTKYWKIAQNMENHHIKAKMRFNTNNIDSMRSRNFKNEFFLKIFEKMEIFYASQCNAGALILAQPSNK